MEKNIDTYKKSASYNTSIEITMGHCLLTIVILLNNLLNIV